MVNRETCNVQGLCGFLERQLLCGAAARSLVVGGLGPRHRHHAARGLCLPPGAWAVAASAWTTAAWLGASLAVYWVSMLVMVLPVE